MGFLMVQHTNMSPYAVTSDHNLDYDPSDGVSRTTYYIKCREQTRVQSSVGGSTVKNCKPVDGKHVDPAYHLTLNEQCNLDCVPCAGTFYLQAA